LRALITQINYVANKLHAPRYFHIYTWRRWLLFLVINLYSTIFFYITCARSRFFSAFTLQFCFLACFRSLPQTACSLTNNYFIASFPTSEPTTFTLTINMCFIGLSCRQKQILQSIVHFSYICMTISRLKDSSKVANCPRTCRCHDSFAKPQTKCAINHWRQILSL
jgi:hypothetical protein